MRGRKAVLREAVETWSAHKVEVLLLRRSGGLMSSKPRRVGLFDDARLVKKLANVAGPCMESPDTTGLFCICAKRQIQPVSHGHPRLPIARGRLCMRCTTSQKERRVEHVTLEIGIEGPGDSLIGYSGNSRKLFTCIFSWKTTGLRSLQASMIS